MVFLILMGNQKLFQVFYFSVDPAFRLDLTPFSFEQKVPLIIPKINRESIVGKAESKIDRTNFKDYLIMPKERDFFKWTFALYDLCNHLPINKVPVCDFMKIGIRIAMFFKRRENTLFFLELSEELHDEIDDLLKDAAAG